MPVVDQQARRTRRDSFSALASSASDGERPGAVARADGQDAHADCAAGSPPADAPAAERLTAGVKGSTPANMAMLEQETTSEPSARDRRVAFQQSPDPGEAAPEPVGDAAAGLPEQATWQAPKQATVGVMAARRAAAKRQRPDNERDRPRRAAIERVELRLKQLHADQQIGLGLDEMSQPWAGEQEAAGGGWQPWQQQPVHAFEADVPEDVDWDTKFTGRATAWARPGDTRFRRCHDLAADLRHAERCKAAGEPVVWRREQERLCSVCSSALHTKTNCPSKVYSQQAPANAAGDDAESAAVPEWVSHLRPEAVAVLHALRQLSGAALAQPQLDTFREQLPGSFSPEALLALGVVLNAAMQGDRGQDASREDIQQ